jgi:hypothetical protein
MNYKVLEDYLEEIDHYLAIKDGKDEILSEIKSHILEKTESETGKITEDTLKTTIGNYGNPRAIAEKYIEDYQIISPVYKKYLFLYTGLLFIFHYLLIVISAFTNHEMVFFPFFYIPIMEANSQIWIKLILYLPMTFLYDFGLVCLILYFITQNKGEIKLPWFEINLCRLIKKPIKEEKPKKTILVIMFLATLAVIFVYIRFNTLFFLTVGAGKTTSLFNKYISKWLSLSVIFIFILETLHYSIRFFIDSTWTKLIKNGILLIILWFISNLPIKSALIDFPAIDLNAICTIALLLLTILAAINFIKSLIEFIYSRKNSVNENT